MPTEVVTRIEQCAYCLCDTVVVTVEQLLTTRDVVASTVIEKTACTRADCIGSKMQPR